MKNSPATSQRDACRARLAFTLVEVLTSVFTLSIVTISAYAMISTGFNVIQLARENLRATQILDEKMETIRLYTWDQIRSNGFIPADFTAPFYIGTTNTNTWGGITYHGSVSISNAPVNESYANDLKQVTVEVRWTNAGAARSRQMQSFISRYGLQNYVY